MQAQIDGNVMKARYTLPPRQKVSPPPKAFAVAPKRDTPRTDNASADVNKDGPKRQRECIYVVLGIFFVCIYNIGWFLFLLNFGSMIPAS